MSDGLSSKYVSSTYGISVVSSKRHSKRKSAASKGLPAWEAALRAAGLGVIAYLINQLGKAANYLFNSWWVLSLPITCILFLISSDFLILTALKDSAAHLFFDEIGLVIPSERRDEVEILKSQVLQYIYLFVLFLCLVHWRAIYGYLKQWKHWAIIILCLLAGMSYSIDPVKVFTNSALIVIGLLVAILFTSAHSEERKFNAYYLAVFIPMLILNVGSFAVFFLYDIPLIEFLFSPNRYGGLAGNPNSLGATVVLGYWAAISLVLSTSGHILLRILALCSLPLFVLHLFMTGSGTSIIAVVVVTVAVFWLRLLAFFKPHVRLAINLGLIVFAILVMLVVFIAASPTELFLSITESLGKDRSLTGRTEIWNVAQDAIRQNPYFGWGFDSHASVKSIGLFDIKFNHYHNGFLDTLIVGGVVLMSLVIYNLCRFVRAFVLAFRRDASAFPLMLPLLILLILNLSEYSLLRPNSPIWLVYVTAFVMLTYRESDSLRTFLSKKSKPLLKRRSRKRQLRWA